MLHEVHLAASQQLIDDLTWWLQTLERWATNAEEHGVVYFASALLTSNSLKNGRILVSDASG